jgi:lipoprotein-releasing system ATP-binding protein
MQIRIENLGKTYQDAGAELVVLQDLSHTFPEKGRVAILGRSGVGKSTFLHLLGGLERPSEGEIYYGETRLSQLKDDALSEFRGQNVGFIFQFHHLLPEFTALENVLMPLVIQGISHREATEKASRLLDRVGLTKRLTHRPGELSGGEQQRVAIARALVSNPRVILADEPTGNLDFKTAESVKAILFELNEELNNVLIIVTHSRDLAAEMDFVFAMQPGGGLLKETTR